MVSSSKFQKKIPIRSVIMEKIDIKFFPALHTKVGIQGSHFVKKQN
jgi:hypothetical protein